MRTATSHRYNPSEVTPLLGIVVGLGLLMPAVCAPHLDFLALPALVVFLPSLLFGTR